VEVRSGWSSPAGSRRETPVAVACLFQGSALWRGVFYVQAVGWAWLSRDWAPGLAFKHANWAPGFHDWNKRSYQIERPQPRRQHKVMGPKCVNSWSLLF
jgi:hypothetical protein